MKKIAVLDYGVGNLLSVTRALKKCNVEVEIIFPSFSNAQHETLIIPGVGAFPQAIKTIEQSNGLHLIHQHAKKGNRIIGICLGMQLLLEESLEFGRTQGLGLIPGSVKPIPPQDKFNTPLRIPHIGWRPLNFSTTSPKALLEFEHDFMYFVHSFTCFTKDPLDTIATTQYGGHSIAAIIRKNNIFGCQFHPEKSGQRGIALLESLIML